MPALTWPPVPPREAPPLPAMNRVVVRQTPRAALCGLAVSTLLMLSVASPAALAHDEVQVGAAGEAFSLPAHVPLAGYSRRHGRPSRGVHDPVGVRALVFQQGPASAALVSCDLLIIDERLFDAVRRRLRARGLPKDLVLLLAATHTHSGPGAYGAGFLEQLSMGHFDLRVFDAIVNTITQTVTRAWEARGPVRMAAATVQTDGLVENRMNLNGPIDAELSVIGFYYPAAETPFAVVTDFAAHPTTLGAWNQQLSADYPGVLVREVERRFPGSTCLFLAGSVGDQAPVKSGEAFGRAEWIGLKLAALAVQALARMTPEAPSALAARQDVVTLPPPALRLGRVVLPRWLGRRLVDDDATLSVLRVGDAAFLGAPCDLAAALGARLKAAGRAQGMFPVVVGFTSDYIGYCMPAALYEANRYEASMAFNGPRAGELVTENIARLLGGLAKREK